MVVAFHAATLATGRALPLTRTGLSPVGTRQLSWRTKGGPKYLAFYELESVAVLQTPAFTNRPRTPWGQKVSPTVIGKNLTRVVREQIYPDGIEMPERGMAPVLQIGRMSVPAEVDAK